MRTRTAFLKHGEKDIRNRDEKNGGNMLIEKNWETKKMYKSAPVPDFWEVKNNRHVLLQLPVVQAFAVWARYVQASSEQRWENKTFDDRVLDD